VECMAVECMAVECMAEVTAEAMVVVAAATNNISVHV
jgi:hypothetical protein